MGILKVLLVALCLVVPDGTWLQVNAPEGISFLFPNTPQKRTEDVNGIPSVIYQTKDLVCVAGIVCSDLSASEIPTDSLAMRQIYEMMKAATLGMETAVLKQETAVPDDSLFIRELEYTLAQGKYEMTYYRRFIFKGRRIYQASIGAQNRYIDLLQKKRETFFNSISFTDEENNNHLNP